MQYGNCSLTKVNTRFLIKGWGDMTQTVQFNITLVKLPTIKQNRLLLHFQLINIITVGSGNYTSSMGWLCREDFEKKFILILIESLYKLMIKRINKSGHFLSYNWTISIGLTSGTGAKTIPTWLSIGTD